MEEMARPPRGPLASELSRRDLLQRASALGLGGMVLSALPVAERILAADPAVAATPVDDAFLQAFADTLIPGRKAARTDLGDSIDQRAIAGVDPEPGAVEADALRLFKNPLVGFDRVATPFVADLSARALRQGGVFLSLPFDKRVAAVKEGLSFSNPDRVLYEIPAAVVFTAFCAAGTQPNATKKTASGYRVMGYPGAAPKGYRSFSYRKKLAKGRTKKGNLP